MRVTPSAVPDCAASVARHQSKPQRSVRVWLIQHVRRDIGRVRRGGWLLGRREPDQKMTLRRTCLSVPSSRASGEPGAPGTRGCLRTRRHGGVAESITRRWPGGDRPDEKTLDGQVGVGDDVTAADLGPDPDAATRLSLNELAGMDCNRHRDCKQYRERCPFVDEPAVCVRHDSLASQSARDWLTLRAARRQPIHPSSTGIVAGRAGASPRR
jgi:hypothetical protein